MFNIQEVLKERNKWKYGCAMHYYYVSHCYFCLLTNGFNGKNKAVIKYLNLQSAMRPITDCNELHIPNPMRPIN